MPSLGPRADNSWSANEFESQARENRKQRVISLLAEGLPVPQGRIFDLLRLLAQPVLDLNGITEIVRTEPLLNTHVEGLLRSYSCDENPAKRAGVPEFLILLGSDRLRILALGCALAEFAGKRLPVEVMRDFWQHSILTALISSSDCPGNAPGKCPNAPIWLVSSRYRTTSFDGCRPRAAGAGSRPACRAAPRAGRSASYFGIDHTEVGRWMALSGNLPGLDGRGAWLIITTLQVVTIDDLPVAIVATADRCSHLPEPMARRRETVAGRFIAQPFGMN